MSEIHPAFDLETYAKDVVDPEVEALTFDLLCEGIVTSGKLDQFKDQLRTAYNKDRLNLVVLGTGGTFQSSKTDRGYAPKGTLQDSFKAMRLPYNRDQVILNLFELFKIDSAKLTPEQIRFVAHVLIQLLTDCDDCFDGIVITHGTDTMAETANYLSLILGRGLKKPVIITGSQYTARLKHSDALYHMDNCLKVHEFLREHGVAEVMLLCGNELIRGAWAEKISDRDSDAYESFNKRAIVELRNRMVKSWRVAPFALRRSDTIPFLPANVVTHEADIPMQKLTDISPAALARIITTNRISIFTLLGSATCPDTHAEVLTQAARRGKAVFLRSPFHDAILSTGTYAAGSALAKSRIPQVKGTESFIRAKLNWLWHSLGLESTHQEGLGAILSPRQHQQLYTSMSQNVIGEWD